MKRVFLHFKRLVKKIGFILCFAFAISPLTGLGLLILSMGISMLLFKDPVDVEAEVEELLNHFTEEELAIILDDKVDEKVSDDDYLSLVARYQSYICENKKIDDITVWTGSEVNKDSFIYCYELNDRKIISFDIDKQKECIRNSLDKNNVQTSRIISSGRSLVFRYTFKCSGGINDVIFSNDELRNL